MKKEVRLSDVSTPHTAKQQSQLDLTEELAQIINLVRQNTGYGYQLYKLEVRGRTEWQ